MITQTIEAYLQTNVIDSSDVQEYSNSAWFSQVIMFEFLDKFFNKDVPQDNVLIIGGMTDRNKFMYLSYPNNLSFCYTTIFKAKFLNDDHTCVIGGENSSLIIPLIMTNLTPEQRSTFSASDHVIRTPLRSEFNSELDAFTTPQFTTAYPRGMVITLTDKGLITFLNQQQNIIFQVDSNNITTNILLTKRNNVNINEFYEKLNDDYFTNPLYEDSNKNEFIEFLKQRARIDVMDKLKLAYILSKFKHDPIALFGQDMITDMIDTITNNTIALRALFNREGA